MLYDIRLLLSLLVMALSVSSSHAQTAARYRRAEEVRTFQFPDDHGNHADYKTEWWYVTGVLEAADGGGTIGYQATWFRFALSPQAPERASPLAPRDLFFFHGALSDVRRGRHVFDEAGSRGVSNWAGSKSGDLNVFVLDRRLVREADGAWRLSAPIGDARVELKLVPRRPPLLHGRSAGLSEKGPATGQASYYYSQTRLQTEGTIRRADGTSSKVRGTSWFDHEFGSQQLAADQVGWDWFSVPLDDGTDLMLYVIRKRDGSIEPKSSGTLRLADGRRIHLKKGDFEVDVRRRWKSEKSGGEYPSEWQIRVPGHGVDLRVRPLLADQELRTRATTGVNYWEGLCEFEGKSGTRSVRGHGYVELVGYAGEFLHGI